MQEYKLVINLKDGVVEASGDKEFVHLIYEDFKDQLAQAKASLGSNEELGGGTPKRNRTKSSSNTNTQKEADKPVKKTKAANKITPERFDIHGGSNVPSLEEFMKAKQPGRSNAEKIAVIAYYIIELLGQNDFNEGQVEYAYKILGFSRPGHLRQIMINAKNQHDWYEPTEDNDAWVLTRSGDIFVSEQLPKSD